ncbi:ABC transporter ATP-binding protein [bacterium]|jgi:lipopolysaccharide transport system ATP-binding protein|nr:ABC transporter ATP-binding protein [bacterium]
MKVIEVQNLCKKYIIDSYKSKVSAQTQKKSWNLFLNRKNKEQFYALKDVSFDVKEGEVLGIIGKNGSGKSTVLKVLSKITTPTSGTIVTRGRIASLLEVGTGFHEELTGKENIFLNGAILGMKSHEIKKQFDEIIDFSGVEKFLNVPIKRYSSGMKLRLAFAIAANLEPEILIIDEVLAVGDVEFQKKCIKQMGSLKETGRTIIFVSHNMSAIKALCNRALCLSKGTVVASGNVNDVVDKYYLKKGISNLYSIAFSGENSLENDFVKLISITARDKNGYAKSSFAIQEDVIVDVEYLVKRNDRSISIVLSALSKDGTLIFKVLDCSVIRWGEKRESGLYVSSCTIPKNFFNDISIDVGLEVFVEGEMRLSSIDTISLVLADEVNDKDSRGGVMLDWPDSYLRPKLYWNIRKLD